MLKRLLAALSLLTLTLIAAVPAAPFPGVPQVPPGPGNAPLPRTGPLARGRGRGARAGRSGALPGDLPGRQDARRGMHRSVDLPARPGHGRDENHPGRRRARLRSRWSASPSTARPSSGVSDDNRLRLWDVASGKMIKAIPALGELETSRACRRSFPSAMAISPDSTRIAVGGGGTTNRSHTIGGDNSTFFVIRVLDAENGRASCGPTSADAAISPSSRSHPTARPWPAPRTARSGSGMPVQGDIERTLRPKSGTVWAIAFSPDNRLLAGYGAACRRGEAASWLTVWDVRSGAIVLSIDAGEASGAAAPGTLAFSPDGKSIASAAVEIADGRISIGGKMLPRAEGVQLHQVLGCGDRDLGPDLAGGRSG